MSTGVFSVMIIARGVATFPAMEALQPVRSSDEPDITKSQIEILVSDQADVFDAIPSVSLGNHYWPDLHHWGNQHCRRKLNRRQQHPHLPVRRNHTP